LKFELLLSQRLDFSIGESDASFLGRIEVPKCRNHSLLFTEIKVLPTILLKVLSKFILYSSFRWTKKIVRH